MTIELITMWYNEEFLAPFFLNHYSFVDRIHIFLDSDTDDGTRNIVDKYKNVSIHDLTFPDKFDDIIKQQVTNDLYTKLDCDWVFGVDADEFIFLPDNYLEEHTDSVYFTHLWNVFRHHTERDLDSTRPVREQRRHGTNELDDGSHRDAYIKMNIVKAKEDWKWSLGFHGGSLNGSEWTYYTSPSYPAGITHLPPVPGAHWANADVSYAIERRVKNRRERMSQVNLSHGWCIQNFHITEAAIRERLKRHENDPRVL